MGDYLDAWPRCVLQGQERHLARCLKATHPLFTLQTCISDSQLVFILI